jgi:hypothetical protein
MMYKKALKKRPRGESTSRDPCAASDERRPTHRTARFAFDARVFLSFVFVFFSWRGDL